MTTIERRGSRDLVPAGGVWAATAARFTSSADRQTRLFWD
jgi:hypothetical protein